MAVAIDTNVLTSLLAGQEPEATQSRIVLRDAKQRDTLVISAPVYAETSATSGEVAAILDRFLHDTGIGVDWQLDEAVWRLGGLAYRGYAERRRAQRGDPGPRRILADFVIGAHASLHASALITSDTGVYRAAFPGLIVIRPAADQS